MMKASSHSDLPATIQNRLAKRLAKGSMVPRRSTSDSAAKITHPLCVDDLAFVDLTDVNVDTSCVRLLPTAGALRVKALALCEVDSDVIVATSNPRLDRVRSFVDRHLKRSYQLVAVDEKKLMRLISSCSAKSSTSQKSSVSENESLTGEAVIACEELLRSAAVRGASDIHLVPSESHARVKFRVDGVLEDHGELKRDAYAGIVSRFKVLASLDVSNSRLPQDGRFSIADPFSKAASSTNSAKGSSRIDVRTATIPTRFGERVTLRLLRSLPKDTSVSDLGMQGQELAAFQNAIRSAHGLILLTGPTGCGKSTTLYAAIQQMLRTGVGNVMTVEDPIEYEIDGATQVEVDAGDRVSFSKALRSILRHDPNVIMLGEIRDAETAEMAIKASLTGHLVFSTLHTNTAAGVVTRLLDMEVEPFLVAATLRLSLAQRLVRRLCAHCRQPTSITAEQAIELGSPELVGEPAWEPQGCVYCAGKGYRGRLALFEMLNGGATVSDLISSNATDNALHSHANNEQHSSLLRDGIQRILTGSVSIAEVTNAVKAW